MERFQATILKIIELTSSLPRQSDLKEQAPREPEKKPFDGLAGFGLRDQAPLERDPATCEHLWDIWCRESNRDFIIGKEPYPSEKHWIYTRVCKICQDAEACYSIAYPETPDDLDISWISKPF